MTISSAVNKVSYTANGTSKNFTVPFYFIYKSDLKVYRMNGHVQELLTLDTDYTIIGTPEQQDGSIYRNGGTVVMSAMPTAGTRFVILREVPLTQEADYQEGSTFPAALHELALDKLTMAVQQLEEKTDRAVTVDVFSGTDPSSLVSEIETIYNIKDEVITAAENISSIVITANDINAIKDAPNQANLARNSAIEATNSAVTAQLMSDLASESATAASASAGAAEQSAIQASVNAKNGHVVGEIVPVFGTSSYVPFGCVLADGTEYTKALFPTVWNDYLTAATPLLPICTYSEYAADITAYGQCAKFAVDTVNEKFKVPTVKNKLINDLTGIPVVGNGMTLGLTNGTQNGGFSSYFNGNIAQAGTWTGAYGTSVGTTQTGALIDGTKGVTTDPTKSGIETTAGDNSNGVEVRFFVCLAGGVINESMMDWQNYMTALAGKADIDLSNVTAAGKDVMAGMGMPSGEYVDLTLGASGEAYTAPANGYFTYISKGLTYLDMFIDVNGAGIITRATDVSTYVRSFTPARAGEKMTLSYVGTPTGAIFRFYYAEGSK